MPTHYKDFRLPTSSVELSARISRVEGQARADIRSFVTIYSGTLTQHPNYAKT